MSLVIDKAVIKVRFLDRQQRGLTLTNTLVHSTCSNVTLVEVSDHRVICVISEKCNSLKLMIESIYKKVQFCHHRMLSQTSQSKGHTGPSFGSRCTTSYLNSEEAIMSYYYRLESRAAARIGFGLSI